MHAATAVDYGTIKLMRYIYLFVAIFWTLFRGAEILFDNDVTWSKANVDIMNIIPLIRHRPINLV